MKKSVKFLSLVLSLLMLGSSFAACAKDETPDSSANADSQTSPAETVPAASEDTRYISDDLPDANYNGYEFRVLSCRLNDHDSGHLIMFEEVTGDPINDKLFDSKCYIEDRFNTKISMIDALTIEGGDTTFRTSVTGNDHSFDIYLGHDCLTTNLGKQGLCVNLLDVPQFDTSKPWWPANIVASFRLGDKMYNTSTYISYLGLHWTRMMTINKEFAANIGLEVPYQTVRDGDWTLDLLYSQIEGIGRDVDANGKMDEHDEYGLVSGNGTWNCLQEAVDLPPFNHDDTGMPYLDFNVDRTQQYVEMMRKIIRGKDFLEIGEAGEPVFKLGTALYAYTQVGDAYDTYRMSDVKYGFLPTPKLDDQQEEYINCCTDMPWCLPKTLYGETLDTVATIVEAMSCYNYNFVLPIYFEGALKSRISDAPDDSEMLQLISDTRTISFTYNYSLPFNNIVLDCVFGQNEVASYYKKNKRIAEKTLERLIESYATME